MSTSLTLDKYGELSLSILRDKTLSVSDYLIYFTDLIIQKHLKENSGLVFLGRSSGPLFNIAKGIAKKGLEEKVRLIDLPRIVLERNSDKDVLQYLTDNGAFKEDSATIIDEGGRGKFMSRVTKIIRNGMGNDYDFNTYQLFSLDPRNPSRLYENPLESLPLLRALLFLCNQPHSHRLTGELRRDKFGKLYALKNPTSELEQFGATEIRNVLNTEAQKYRAIK